MGQHRSKLDRHAAELLALRRAGDTLAQLTRWLRFERDTVVAATTAGRWLAKVDTLRVNPTLGFDAVAALDELRARDRELRFPRLAVSSIEEYGYHVLQLRAQGATIGECHRALRHEHGLRVDRLPLASQARQWRGVAVPAAAGTSRATGSAPGRPIRTSRRRGSSSAYGASS